MKKISNISRIILKYLSGRFPAKTEERVQRWLIKDENAEEKESASLTYWDSLKTDVDSETYPGLHRVNERIGHANKKVIKMPLRRRLSRVAAVLLPLFMIAGGYAYYQSAQNRMIEIYVAYGEEKHLFLPDSSEIWMNAGTTIRYPQKFNKDTRVVQLDGEAYFSVRRDESKPFVVNTQSLSVNVLGTKFNIKAYPDEKQVTATLTSGKIEVKVEEESHLLKPNEQLSFHKETSVVNIVEIPSDETNAWLEGQLIFTNASMGEILKALERKFNVSIEDKTSIPATKIYTVKFLKNETVDEVLSILEDITNLTYQINGKQIIVYGNE